jgi:hypothetical protein
MFAVIAVAKMMSSVYDEAAGLDRRHTYAGSATAPD